MVVYNQYELLYNIFFYSVALPITIGLSRWKILTRSERWVVAFLLALLADELLSILCIALHTRNHFLFHLQTITVLFTVAGVYRDISGTKQLVWQIALCLSVLMNIEVAFGVGFNHINTVTLALSRLLAAVYASISLLRLLSAARVESLTAKPMVYIHIGFFIFGAFSTVTACFMSYFIETSIEMYFFFTNMSAMMGAVAFVFFSIGFLRVKPIWLSRTRL